MKTIQVVAAVIEMDGRVLCVQRGPHKFSYIHQKWEFPGGKIENGETECDALHREIREELELSIEIHSHLTTVQHTYSDFHLVMSTYRCSLTKELPREGVSLKEHITCRWLNPSSTEFVQLDWAAADLPIVSILRN